MSLKHAFSIMKNAGKIATDALIGPVYYNKGYAMKDVINGPVDLNSGRVVVNNPSVDRSGRILVDSLTNEKSDDKPERYSQ
jgi:hypothetical protein